MAKYEPTEEEKEILERLKKFEAENDALPESEQENNLRRDRFFGQEAIGLDDDYNPQPEPRRRRGDD